MARAGRSTQTLTVSPGGGGWTVSEAEASIEAAAAAEELSSAVVASLKALPKEYHCHIMIKSLLGKLKKEAQFLSIVISTLAKHR